MREIEAGMNIRVLSSWGLKEGERREQSITRAEVVLFPMRKQSCGTAAEPQPEETAARQMSSQHQGDTCSISGLLS